jgi:hypothetical protein
MDYIQRGTFHITEAKTGNNPNSQQWGNCSLMKQSGLYYSAVISNDMHVEF